MKYVIEGHTVENLGDHGREIVVAFEPIPGEKVTDLIQRVANKLDRRYKTASDQPPRRMPTGDYIVIRQIEESP